MPIRFITNIIKPWDELSLLLSKPFAFQPDISDITRIAGSLAVSIKHQAEVAGAKRAYVDSQSSSNNVMSDVADAWKHGELRDPSRNNKLIVSSQFECNAEGYFRFLRNVITVKHATLGDLDFMATAKDAISYWIGALKIPINWAASIQEGDSEFHETAALYFNPKYQVSMSLLNLLFVTRGSDGLFQPYDPPEVRFVLYEYEDITS